MLINRLTHRSICFCYRFCLDNLCDFKYLKLNTNDDDNLLAINNNCQSVIINAQPFSLGGKIAVRSDAENGTVFTVTLQAAP